MARAVPLGALDWPGFLADFHSARPGAVEDVLTRLRAGEHNPYRWLARAVSAVSGSVLDIACGSGAMSRELAGKSQLVVGLDLSAPELTTAASRHPGPWIQADALRLPLADDSVDAVISCMGFAVIQPLWQLVAEVRRVLRPGGMLAVIAPSVRPMNAADLRTAGKLYAVLRMSPQFPASLERTGLAGLLADANFSVVEDARERYHYQVYDHRDASRFLDALYLPRSRRLRKQAAIDLLVRRADKFGSAQVPVPMRRLVALK